MIEVPPPTAFDELRATRLVWPLAIWPAGDRQLWDIVRAGKGPEGQDSPATMWVAATARNNATGYGRYLAWLLANGLMVEDELVEARVTPSRSAPYTEELKQAVSSVSASMALRQLIATCKALAPHANLAWLQRRAMRLKTRAKPSREKRNVVQNSLDLYRYGTELMDQAEIGKGRELAVARRYQTGLIIALLAARPLRIRNFQAIIIGTSLRWDGNAYWLTFTRDETKTGTMIDEPLTRDLVPYLERYLQIHRPLLLRQAVKVGGKTTHRALWSTGQASRWRRQPCGTGSSSTQNSVSHRDLPPLFRDCLLTSVAIDQPDLMRISATLLGHTSLKTGVKHYNQAQMLDASRRFGSTITELRETMLDQKPRKAPTDT